MHFINISGSSKDVQSINVLQKSILYTNMRPWNKIEVVDKLYDQNWRFLCKLGRRFDNVLLSNLYWLLKLREFSIQALSWLVLKTKRLEYIVIHYFVGCIFATRNYMPVTPCHMIKLKKCIFIPRFLFHINQESPVT